MLAQTLHRFSVEEYYRMADAGLLPPDARVELLDGKIIDMPPIGPLHGGSVNRLVELFVQLSRGRWQVAAQNPIRLDDYSEPQPDIALLKPARDYYSRRHPRPEDVFLLVEVADSSLDSDRQNKLSAYARAGISEVWIVNLPDGLIETYGNPVPSGYGVRRVFRTGDLLSPEAFPDVSLEAAALMFAAD